MQPVQIGDLQPYDWRRDRRFAGCVVAAALLLNAAFRENGDGYFTFLRIYVCGLAAILALLDWRNGKIWLPLSGALIAILFNPIRVIDMERETWFGYDIAAAGWFVAVGAWPLLRAARRVSKEWTIALAILGLICVSVIIASKNGYSDLANNTMNIDENLTTTDINATAAEMAATDDAKNATAIANTSSEEFSSGLPTNEEIANADEALNAAGNDVDDQSASRSNVPDENYSALADYLKRARGDQQPAAATVPPGDSDDGTPRQF